MIHAVAISASCIKNGKKQIYAAVKKDENGFFGNKIEWDWYPEESIVNINKLSSRTNENPSNPDDQITPSISNTVPVARRPVRNSRKKSKSKESSTKNDEAPNLKHVQMMENDLLYSISTENPHLEAFSKAISKTYVNDNNINKKITKILSFTANRITGQVTWKVKIEDNNRTIEIPHAELISKNRDLFMEYYKSKFIDGEGDVST